MNIATNVIAIPATSDAFVLCEWVSREKQSDSRYRINITEYLNFYNFDKSPAIRQTP
jgi:hypothetical protein